MLLRNLDCDGTQLHAPSPPLAAHELLTTDILVFEIYTPKDMHS